MRLSRLAILFFCAIASGVASPSIQTPTASNLANSVVLIIRHAEKPPEGNSLTPAGEARARAYVKFFQNYKVDGKPFRVDAIFATADTKKSSRPRLTVTPLSRATNLKIDSHFANDEFAELAEALRAKRYGRNIVISWHHGRIPKLIEALGADSEKLLGVKKWPDAVYDWVVQLSYDKAGHLIDSQTKKVLEHLMPEDKAGH